LVYIVLKMYLKFPKTTQEEKVITFVKNCQILSYCVKVKKLIFTKKDSYIYTTFMCFSYMFNFSYILEGLNNRDDNIIEYSCV
jgi:hypothetical protein